MHDLHPQNKKTNDRNTLPSKGKITLPETNIAPENGELPKGDFHLPTIHFQDAMLVYRRVLFQNPQFVNKNTLQNSRA